MKKQKIFSQKAVKALFDAFQSDDSVYLSDTRMPVS